MIENKEEKERPLFTSKLTCNTSFFFFLPLLFRYIENVEGFFFFFFSFFGSPLPFFSFSYLIKLKFFSLFYKQTCNTSLFHLSAAKN